MLLNTEHIEHMEGILRVQYKILLDLPPHFTKQPEANYPPDGQTSDRR